MTFEVLDPIVLAEDLPALGLKRGDLGAIVELHTEEDFEVEFVTTSGHTQALTTLHVNQLRPVGPQDIPAVRNLDAT